MQAQPNIHWLVSLDLRLLAVAKRMPSKSKIRHSLCAWFDTMKWAGKRAKQVSEVRFEAGAESLNLHSGTKSKEKFKQGKSSRTGTNGYDSGDGKSVNVTRLSQEANRSINKSLYWELLKEWLQPD